MRLSASQACSVRPANAIKAQHMTLRHRQPLNDHAGRSPQRAAAAGRHPTPPPRRLRLRARRSGREEYEEDYAVFDDEEDWAQEGSSVQPLGLGPIFSTTLRGLSVIADKLTDFAVRFAPEDASPAVVRVAVNAGLVLLALSFVKSILSFFLTLGSIVLGAYVAVKVFGIDVPGVTSSGAGSAGGGGGGRQKLRQQQQQQQAKRRPDPRARQSEFQGLLGGGGSGGRGRDGEDSGLLDVWFERKGSAKGGSSSGKDKDKRRR